MMHVSPILIVLTNTPVFPVFQVLNVKGVSFLGPPFCADIQSVTNFSPFYICSVSCSSRTYCYCCLPNLLLFLLLISLVAL